MAETLVSAARPLPWGLLRAARQRQFWTSHLLQPVCSFLPVALLLATTNLDQQIAWSWAYDAVLGRFPARHAYWAERLVHGYGRDLIWLVALTCAALLVASLRTPALRRWRGSLWFAIVGIGVASGLIGLLKQMTNVHCPWELQGFGGTFQYVSLFAQRDAHAATGACFPGAHSGSGFALFALYFAFRDKNRRLAITGLIAALCVGVIFSFGQEARGAHFLSHDLWSAFIAWLTCLALYVPARRRLSSR